MNEEIYTKVTRFIEDQTKVATGKLHGNTVIQTDLGVDGEDGIELMEAFGREFNVDMTSFVPSRHFGPEAGLNPFSLLKSLLCATERAQYLPITLNDLIRAAQARKWL